MATAALKSLPGYRGVLTTIGAAYVLLAVMNLAQGAAKALEPFHVVMVLAFASVLVRGRVAAKESNPAVIGD